MVSMAVEVLELHQQQTKPRSSSSCRARTVMWSCPFISLDLIVLICANIKEPIRELYKIKLLFKS